MSLPWGLPRPKFGRHIPPRAAGPKPPGDRFEHLTVITPRTTLTTDATGQRRLYQLPQLIGNHTSPDHPAMIDLPTIILWETRSRHPAPCRGAGHDACALLPRRPPQIRSP